MIKTKSVHDVIEATDGQRILVSCYWPKYADLKIVDLWLPELGSDLELAKNWQRKKFDWNFFVEDYLKKMEKPEIKKILQQIAITSINKNITLVGHSRSSSICHRSILKKLLEDLI